VTALGERPNHANQQSRSGIEQQAQSTDEAKTARQTWRQLDSCSSARSPYCTTCHPVTSRPQLPKPRTVRSRPPRRSIRDPETSTGAPPNEIDGRLSGGSPGSGCLMASTSSGQIAKSAKKPNGPRLSQSAARPEVRNPKRRRAVSSGASSGMKCPAEMGPPETSSAQVFHTSSGWYQLSTAPV
jgi:hypothetical protein